MARRMPVLLAKGDRAVNWQQRRRTAPPLLAFGEQRFCSGAAHARLRRACAGNGPYGAYKKLSKRFYPPPPLRG